MASGLTVAAEKIPGLASVSFALFIPVGSAADPAGRCGLTSLASEMIMRGASDRDARALTEAMDGLGIERNVDYSLEYLLLSGSCLSTHVPRALSLFRDILLAPRLDQEELAPSIELSLQGILAVEDTPSEKLFVELGKRYLPPPFDKPSKGIAGEIEAVTIGDLRGICSYRSPRGMILSMAGDIEMTAANAMALDIFRDFPPAPDFPRFPMSPTHPEPGHVMKADAHQVQIGMAMPSLPLSHPDYVKSLLSVTVLSGGMSGRLFVEVREKRGLVYSVRAFYSTMRDRGDIYVYAGTTPEKAAETERVVRGELERLTEGITAEELARARTQLRSSVVMSQESSRGRATTMAMDLFRLGRVREPDDIIGAIQRIELDEMNAFLSRLEPRPFVMTLGPAGAGVAAA